jgi:hypothetical protein
MEERESGPGGVVTMVCITCGAEQFFDRTMPGALTCTKCGGTVFRQFDTPTVPDEATLDQLDQQARSRSYGDPSPGTAPDEIADLDNK